MPVALTVNWVLWVGIIMVFATILKTLPMSDNMKVAFGTFSIFFGSYYCLMSRGERLQCCVSTSCPHCRFRACRRLL